MGKKISLTPGNFKGMKIQRNYNAKPPKIGGGMGIKPPAVIAKALGVNINMPIHSAAVAGLVNHPNADVARAAKKLMKKY